MAKIVYLAWGSLKWNVENLPIKSPDSWIYSNLEIPLEFSRISDRGKGRLTLVIDVEHGRKNRIWYSYSTLKNVDKAIKELKIREGTSIDNIAYINLKSNKERHLNTPNIIAGKIKEWMIKEDIEIAIWTDLKSNWKDIMKTEYTVERAYKYFENSPLETRLKILEYVYKATRITKIKTDFSNYFFEKLKK